MESELRITSTSSSRRCLDCLYLLFEGQEYSLALRKPYKAKVNVSQYSSLSWDKKLEMESCRLIACKWEIVIGSLVLEFFLPECLIPVHR